MAKNTIWGIETSIDLRNCAPDLIRNAQTIRMFVTELCIILDVKKFGDTVVVDFGDDPRVSGFSMTQLIETSLLSGHFVNQTNAAYINIFSCSTYDPLAAANFTKDFFKAKNYDFIVNYRQVG